MEENDNRTNTRKEFDKLKEAYASIKDSSVYSYYKQYKQIMDKMQKYDELLSHLNKTCEIPGEFDTLNGIDDAIDSISEKYEDIKEKQEIMKTSHDVILKDLDDESLKNLRIYNNYFDKFVKNAQDSNLEPTKEDDLKMEEARDALAEQLNILDLDRLLNFDKNNIIMDNELKSLEKLFDALRSKRKNVEKLEELEVFKDEFSKIEKIEEELPKNSEYINELFKGKEELEEVAESLNEVSFEEAKEAKNFLDIPDYYTEDFTEEEKLGVFDEKNNIKNQELYQKIITDIEYQRQEQLGNLDKNIQNIEQSIGDNNKEDIEKELRDINEKEEANEVIIKYIDKIEELERRHSELAERKVDLRFTITNLNRSFDPLDQLDYLEKVSAAREELDAIDDEIDKLNEEIKLTDQEMSIDEAFIAALEEEIADLKEKKAKLNENPEQNRELYDENTMERIQNIDILENYVEQIKELKM